MGRTDGRVPGLRQPMVHAAQTRTALERAATEEEEARSRTGPSWTAPSA